MSGYGKPDKNEKVSGKPFRELFKEKQKKLAKEKESWQDEDKDC